MQNLRVRRLATAAVKNDSGSRDSCGFEKFKEADWDPLFSIEKSSKNYFGLTFLSEILFISIIIIINISTELLIREETDYSEKLPLPTQPLLLHIVVIFLSFSY